VKQRSQQKISDLIAEKVYRFERREMLQAFLQRDFLFSKILQYWTKEI